MSLTRSLGYSDPVDSLLADIFRLFFNALEGERYQKYDM